MDYVIEKDIPVPTAREKSGKWKRILNEMDEGDSILLPHIKAHRFQQSIRNDRPHGKIWDIRSRKESNDMTRIWKIKNERNL